MPEEYVVEVRLENKESLDVLAHSLSEVYGELRRLNTSLNQFQKDALTTARAVQECTESMRDITQEIAESTKVLKTQNIVTQKSTKQTTQLASANQRTTAEVKKQATALTQLRGVMLGVAAAVAVAVVAYTKQEKILKAVNMLEHRKLTLAVLLKKAVEKNLITWGTAAKVLVGYGTGLKSASWAANTLTKSMTKTAFAAVVNTKQFQEVARVLSQFTTTSNIASAAVEGVKQGLIESARSSEETKAALVGIYSVLKTIDAASNAYQRLTTTQEMNRRSALELTEQILKTINASQQETEEIDREAKVTRHATMEAERRTTVLTWMKRALIGVAAAVAAVTISQRQRERIESILYKLDQRRHVMALSLAARLAEYEAQHRTTARVLASFGSVVSSLIRTTYNYARGSYDARVAVNAFTKTVKTAITTTVTELRRAPTEWLRLVKSSFLEASRLIDVYLASATGRTTRALGFLLVMIPKNVAIALVSALSGIVSKVLPTFVRELGGALLSVRENFAEAAKGSTALKAALVSLKSLARDVGVAFINLGKGVHTAILTGVVATTTLSKSVMDEAAKSATTFGETMKGVAKALIAPVAAIVTPFTDLPGVLIPKLREVMTTFKQFEVSTWSLARTTYEATRESASALRSFAAASKVFLVAHLDAVKDVIGASVKHFKIWLATLRVSEKQIPLLLKPFTLLLGSLAILSGRLLKLSPSFKSFGTTIESAGWALNRASSFTRVFSAVTTNLDRGLTEITGTSKSVTRGFGEVAKAAGLQKESILGLLGGLGKLVVHYLLVYKWHLTVAHGLEALSHLIANIGRTWVASLHHAFEVSVEFLRTELDLIRATQRYQELTKDATRTTAEWVDWTDKLAISLGKDIAPMRRVTGVLLDYAAVYGLTRSETERFIKLMIDVSTYLGTDVFMALRHVRGALAGLSLSAMYLGIQVEALKDRTKHYEEQLRKTGVAAGVDIKQKARLLALMDELNYLQGMTNKLMDTGYGAVHRYKVAQQALANAIGEAAAPAMSSLYNIMTKVIGGILGLGRGFMRAYVGVKAFLGVALQFAGSIGVLAAKVLILMETLHMLEVVLTFVNKSLYSLPIASVPFLRSILRMEGEAVKFKDIWTVAGNTIRFGARLALREIKDLVVSGVSMLSKLAASATAASKAFLTIRVPTFAVATLYGERFARAIAKQDTVASRLTETLRSVGRANLETGVHMAACATSFMWLRHNVVLCTKKILDFGKAIVQMGRLILFVRIPELIKNFKDLAITIAGAGVAVVQWMSKARTPATKYADTIAETVRRTHGMEAATRAWGGAFLQAIGLVKLSETRFAGLLGRFRGLITFISNIGIGTLGVLGEKFKLLWSIVRTVGVRFSLIAMAVLGAFRAFENLINAISETFGVTIKLTTVIKAVGTILYDIVKPIVWLGKLAVDVIAGVLTEAFAGLSLTLGLTLKLLERFPWIGGKVKGLGDKFVELSFRLDEMAKGSKTSVKATRDLRTEIENLIKTLETRERERGLNLAVAESYKVLIERAIDYKYALEAEQKLRRDLEETKKSGILSERALRAQREHLQKVTLEANSAENKFKKAIEETTKATKTEIDQVKNLGDAYIEHLRTHRGLEPALKDQATLYGLISKVQEDQARLMVGSASAAQDLASDFDQLADLFSKWAETADAEAKPALEAQAKHLKKLAEELREVGGNLEEHPELLDKLTDAYTKSAAATAVFSSETKKLKLQQDLLRAAIEAAAKAPPLKPETPEEFKKRLAEVVAIEKELRRIREEGYKKLQIQAALGVDTLDEQIKREVALTRKIREKLNALREGSEVYEETFRQYRSHIEKVVSLQTQFISQVAKSSEAYLSGVKSARDFEAQRLELLRRGSAEYEAAHARRKALDADYVGSLERIISAYEKLATSAVVAPRARQAALEQLRSIHTNLIQQVRTLQLEYLRAQKNVEKMRDALDVMRMEFRHAEEDMVNVHKSAEDRKREASERAEEYMSKAWDRYYKGNYEAAENLARKAIPLYKQMAEAAAEKAKEMWKGAGPEIAEFMAKQAREEGARKVKEVHDFILMLADKRIEKEKEEAANIKETMEKMTKLLEDHKAAFEASEEWATRYYTKLEERISSLIKKLKELPREIHVRIIVEESRHVGGLIGKYLRRQFGGLVPGTGKGDIVPALLEPGEYVIPTRVVERLGVSFFESLRKNTPLTPPPVVRMQEGGLVQNLRLNE